jgi:hypothetical protein
VAEVPKPPPNDDVKLADLKQKREKETQGCVEIVCNVLIHPAFLHMKL